MPRTARKRSATGIYHVLVRGVNQQRIFEDDEDCTRFLNDLAIAKRSSGMLVLAYCLMGNHVHLLVEEKDEELGRFMKRLLVRYAGWFNIKYARTGYLFQSRFKSEAVETDEYLSTVICYIYQNPVKARLCGVAQDYKWSSARLLDYDSDIIDNTRLTELFGNKVPIHAAYEEDSTGMLDAAELIRKGKTDTEVAKIMQVVSGSKSTSEFQALSKDQQIDAVKQMLKEGSSIRQTARVTGLSKGLVESWKRRNR